MPDLNKEIKLSDIFRRRAKTPEEVVEGAGEEKPPKERRSLFSRGKGGGEPKPPKEPKKRREPRRGRDKGAAVEPRTALAPPQIPLMRAFNLMPKEEARQGGSRGALPQIAVALLGLVLLAGIGGAYLFTSAGVASKQGELDDLRVQLAELEAQAAAPEDGASALAGEKQSRTAALSAALATRVAWDRVLRELSLVLPDNVWLTTISGATANAAADPAAPAPVDGAAANSVSLVGFAVTQVDVANLLARLAAIPEFASVDLQSSVRDNGGDPDDPGIFSFTILIGVDPLGVPAS